MRLSAAHASFQKSNLVLQHGAKTNVRVIVVKLKSVTRNLSRAPSMHVRILQSSKLWTI